MAKTRQAGLPGSIHFVVLGIIFLLIRVVAPELLNAVLLHSGKNPGLCGKGLNGP